MPSRSAKSEDWTQSFLNILELERANGFNDRAVIGGMDGFVRRWSEAMAGYVGNAPESRELLRPGYGRMTTSRRGEWVDWWLAALAGSSPAREAESNPKTKAAPSPSRSSKATSRKARPTENTPASVTLDSPVSSLKRFTSKTAGQLDRLGIHTVRHLLYHFPHRHIDYSRRAKVSELWPGQEVTVVGQITESQEVPLGRSRRKATKAVLTDETGSVGITWFNRGFLSRTLKPGTNLAVSGKVDGFQNRPVFESPEYDILRPGQEPVNTGRLVPVYPLTAGLVGRTLRGLTWQILQDFQTELEESSPKDMLSRTSLLPLPTALRQAHYPDSLQSRDRSRRRLAFDELLTLQLSVLSRRQKEAGLLEGVGIEAGADFLDGFLSGLPFSLTGAQRRCLDEILADMARGAPPMNRLLQGRSGQRQNRGCAGRFSGGNFPGLPGGDHGAHGGAGRAAFPDGNPAFGRLGRYNPVGELVDRVPGGSGQTDDRGPAHGQHALPPPQPPEGFSRRGNPRPAHWYPRPHSRRGLKCLAWPWPVMDEQHRFGVMQRSALRQKSEERSPHPGDVRNSHSPHVDPDAVRRPGHFRN